MNFFRCVKKNITICLIWVPWFVKSLDLKCGLSFLISSEWADHMYPMHKACKGFDHFL